MVMATSLLAAAALFVVFFGGLALAPTSRVGRVVGAAVAAVLAGAAWAGVVALGRSLGWVNTEEAQFHHLYVLATVGLPLVGAVLMVASVLRPASDARARVGGRLVAGAFLIPALVGVYATHVEPSWLRVDRVSVTVDEASALPADRPIRVGVIADIQTDAFGDYERDAVATLNAAEPDLILVAGDITQVPFSEYPDLAEDAAEVLAGLEAPHGVYLISGNTDPGPLLMEDLAEAAGITWLDDATVELDIDGRAVRLLGVSWPNNRRPGASAAIVEFDRASGVDTIDIVLAHSPDVVFNLPADPAVDLIVAGHTHGGQIQLPFYGPVWNVTELPREVAGGGLHDVAGTQMYVSTGVGVQRGESPKVRFGVRPSVGVVEIG